MITVEADFLVSNQGTIWMFTPVSEEANRMCQDGTIQVEDWQWMGGSFGVDHRMAHALVENLANDGLVLTEE